MRNWGIWIAVALSLTACDPGRKSMRRLNSEYSELRVDGLTVDEAEKAQTLYLAAGIVAEAHKERRSGRDAVDLMEKIRADVKDMLTKARPQLEVMGKEFLEAMRKAEALSDQLRKDVQKKPKRSAFAKFPFKDGDCIAQGSGKEFSKESSLFEITGSKIEKVGKENVLVKRIFAAMKGDFPADWQQKLEKKEAEEEPQIMVEDGLRVDCKRLTALADAYQGAMQVASKYDPLIKKLNQITATVGLQ